MGPRSFALGTLCVASLALARTDLVGCTYFDTVSAYPGGQPFATRIWYVPGSGELCEFLDCGGGRAPPKTTVPGCAAYEGTETYSPSFINPKTLGHVPATVSPAKTSAGTTTAAFSPVITGTEVPAATKVSESSETGSKTSMMTSTPSGSGSRGAAITNTTKPTTISSTGAAAGLPTAGPVLGSWMAAGVVAGLGLF
ncbi:hypothetical protein J3458_000424 [Metarhizium acridum]|uniref:uncharacterized protein n=1 Tax=Metarhizium acridum TaxID=92637 RepID=UPI001C6C6AC3|nr:hypothetical protein J3458_000424 [Metarhizium acridum]